MATQAEVNKALGRARAFVAAKQLPSGEIPLKYIHSVVAGHEQAWMWCSNCFATMFACHALAEDGSPEALVIIERARRFLEGERIPPGIWNFAAKGGRVDPKNLAPDVDTTAGMLSLQERMGWRCSASRWIVETNKRRDGRFYTWITPWNRRTWDPRYWLAVLRDPTWGRFVNFWRGTWVHPRDIDLVINTHVASALGDSTETRGAIEWILQTIELGEEEMHDKWYHDRSSLYLAVGRAYARGISRFGMAYPTVVERIRERQDADGQIGGTAMNTVMSTSALLHLGGRSSYTDSAIDYLCLTQDIDGAWPGGPHWWGGLRDAGWYESRCYTTSLACEALALYAKINDG